MAKEYFVLHLLPSRPDFALTMTADERQIMLQHTAYWSDLMDKGKVVVFGPVFDPKGIYGLGVIAVDSKEEVAAFIANDPAGTINSYEYYPMKAVVPADRANLP